MDGEDVDGEEGMDGEEGICNGSEVLLCFKVTDARLKKLEKDYQSFLEQQAQLEDPVVRLEVRLMGVANRGGPVFCQFGQ